MRLSCRTLISNIPKSLRVALEAGEVVPFVGAGVSMSVKKKNDDGSESNESLFPSWKGFVEILAQALRDEDKPEEAKTANFRKVFNSIFTRSLETLGIDHPIIVFNNTCILPLVGLVIGQFFSFLVILNQ